jgi:hypothetical protein
VTLYIYLFHYFYFLYRTISRSSPPTASFAPPQKKLPSLHMHADRSSLGSPSGEGRIMPFFFRTSVPNNSSLNVGCGNSEDKREVDGMKGYIIPFGWDGEQMTSTCPRESRPSPSLRGSVGVISCAIRIRHQHATKNNIRSGKRQEPRKPRETNKGRNLVLQETIDFKNETLPLNRVLYDIVQFSPPYLSLLKKDPPSPLSEAYPLLHATPCCYPLDISSQRSSDP